MDTGYLDRHLAELLAEPPPLGGPALLATAHYALDAMSCAARESGDAGSPWALGDAWQAGDQGRVTLGIRAPAFRRVRAKRRGQEVEVRDGEVSLRATVATGEHDVVNVEGAGLACEVTLVGHGRQLVVTADASYEVELVHAWPFAAGADEAETHPASPLPGRVVALHVREGSQVQAGAALAVVEGMKMQHTVRAMRAGRVGRVHVVEGQLVDADAVLCEIVAAD